MNSRLFSTLCTITTAATLVLATGCGGGKNESTGDGKDKGGTSSGGAPKKFEALDTKGAGTIEGKIVYDGTPPAPVALKLEKDTDHCKKGNEEETTDPTWRVSANGGVSNVIVWVQAPKGKYFKLTANDKKKKPDVEIKQPHCAFIPHVFAMQPTYFDEDSKTEKSTGQALKIFNNAPIPHNSNVSFANFPQFNKGDNRNMPANSDKPLEFDAIKTGKDKEPGTSERINVVCNIHTWMKAFGMAFDHPFFDVTKDGSFKIENVPAGQEVEVWYWHESMVKPVELKKIKVEDGKTAKLDEVKIK